jgi:hypothetical protein
MDRNPGISKEQWSEMLDVMEKNLKSDENALRKELNNYEVTSVGKPLLTKVRIALDKGLSEKAQELLRSAKPEELTDKRTHELVGYRLWATLLLNLGLVKEARILLSTASREGGLDRSAFGTVSMGLPAYGCLSVVLGAATGDYEEADKALAELVPDVQEQVASSVVPLLARWDVIHMPTAQSPKELSRFEMWYKITPESLTSLRDEKVPEEVLAKLKGLRGRDFKTKQALVDELKKLLAPTEQERFERLVVNHARNPLGLYVGALVGDALLRFAPQGAGLPWQFLTQLPIRLHEPRTNPWKPQTAFWFSRMVPPANLLSAPLVVGSRTDNVLTSVVAAGTAATFSATHKDAAEAIKHVLLFNVPDMEAMQLLRQARATEADLWAIRAWLALEHGRVDRTGEYARRALRAVEIERNEQGDPRITDFPGFRLTRYCQYLLAPGRL